MTDPATGTVSTHDGSAVAKNYSFILVGLLVFPLMIVAFFSAKKKSGQLRGFEQSHSRFQVRTIAFAWIGMAVAALIALSILLWMPGETPLQWAYKKSWFIRQSHLSWLIILWTATRCIRGLYLSGTRRAVQNPGTFWIWPRDK